MNPYIVMLFVLIGGFAYMGYKLFQRIQQMKSAPDSVEKSERDDVQRLLRKQLEEQGEDDTEQDSIHKKSPT